MTYDHEAVMEVVCDAVLATLPKSMPMWERTNYANLIRRDVARRLSPTSPAPEKESHE